MGPGGYNVCPAADPCHALIYGGSHGRGQNAGENPWGDPEAWSFFFEIPEVPAGAEVGLMEFTFRGAADSGYSLPNPLPFMTDYYLNDVSLGSDTHTRHMLWGMNRVCHWLKPTPPDCDTEERKEADFKDFTYALDASDYSAFHPGANNNMTIRLVDAGWILLLSVGFDVGVCDHACTCFADSTNGFWAGDRCDTCAEGYGGSNCDFEIAPVPEESSATGLKVLVAFETILLLGGVTVWFLTMTTVGRELRSKLTGGRSSYDTV